MGPAIGALVAEGTGDIRMPFYCVGVGVLGAGLQAARLPETRPPKLAARAAVNGGTDANADSSAHDHDHGHASASTSASAGAHAHAHADTDTGPSNFSRAKSLVSNPGTYTNNDSAAAAVPARLPARLYSCYHEMFT